MEIEMVFHAACLVLDVLFSKIPDFFMWGFRLGILVSFLSPVSALSARNAWHGDPPSADPVFRNPE